MEWASKTRWKLNNTAIFTTERIDDESTISSRFEKKWEERKKKTLSFIIFLISSHWIPESPASPRYFKQCKKELENLKFNKTSEEETRREYLLDLVKKIIEELEEHTVNNK